MNFNIRVIFSSRFSLLCFQICVLSHGFTSFIDNQEINFSGSCYFFSILNNILSAQMSQILFIRNGLNGSIVSKLLGKKRKHTEFPNCEVCCVVVSVQNMQLLELP